MKIRTLVAATLITAFASTTASAGKLVIDTTNDSTDAIAVGDTLVVAGAASSGGVAGFLGLAGGRALAGSVQVNANGAGCGCKRKVTVDNASDGAIAVGRASAGSTQINL